MHGLLTQADSSAPSMICTVFSSKKRLPAVSYTHLDVYKRQPYDVSTANGEMIFGMNLVVGQRERKEIGARTKRAMEEDVYKRQVLLSSLVVIFPW